MLNNRNQFLDILKGILIISVVFGHALQYGSGSLLLSTGMYWEHPLMRIIYSVHMPLFMGIAGYLSYFSLQKYSVLSYITRRWRQLFLPILVWATSLLCMKIILTGHIPHILQILTSILTTFWFLWAMLICSSLICLCEQIKNSKIKLAVYVGLLIIFACTPDILWWNAHKFMFVCFLSGFYVAKYQFALHITWIKAGMASVLWVISIMLFHKEAYIYTSGFSVVFTQFPNFYDQILMDLFRYISAVLGTISVSYICLGFTKFIQKETAFTHSLTHYIPLCLWKKFVGNLYFINLPICVSFAANYQEFISQFTTQYGRNACYCGDMFRYATDVK